MAGRMGLIECLIVVVALLNGATTQVTAAVEFQVGDNLGWTVPPNISYYSNWASSKKFFVGDTLTYNATNGTQNVVMISEAEYNACAKVISVTVVVHPFSAVHYTLPSTGTYYIICTISNHCELGQKFSFTVESPIGSPTNSTSSLTVGALFVVLTTTVIYFMTYF
ncbi:mavicyanin-like [Quercus suber]|uniref:Blue copper protein n=1 Tax=Quercus suber TaxID=58331 RepID=A0AAW0LMW9_QUESU